MVLSCFDWEDGSRMSESRVQRHHRRRNGELVGPCPAHKYCIATAIRTWNEAWSRGMNDGCTYKSDGSEILGYDSIGRWLFVNGIDLIWLWRGSDQGWFQGRKARNGCLEGPKYLIEVRKFGSWFKVDSGRGGIPKRRESTTVWK
ncbi:hypothetical protein V6N13_130638 [Hibiscus sabdariffa]|uniref:Uncharacterized protein n=2 Tax=Hibiscus sabdariffa TaxID=183260 RepID=A0ABR2P0I8_9ROSI